MNIALVDDEPIYLRQMAKLCHDFAIQHHYNLETVPFSSGEAFLEAFEENAFSIVFLDIYMDGMDGISTAEKMREKDSHCLLVFLTSSEEFMPEAFSCHAFEYITKPFYFHRVERVLQDAIQLLPVSSKYITISSGRTSNIPLFLSDITSVVTDAHYLDIGLADGTATRSRMTMTQFLELTEHDPRFLLINKGIALNADDIVSIENNCCVMKNGTRFPIRIRDRSQIEQSVREYHLKRISSRQPARRGT